ncbi:MAG TPA: hypothetical protein VFS26_04310 [Solirubrobacterales bacterium]|nr:hypothetical protein [Solirubrobacterales bacterium]
MSDQLGRAAVRIAIRYLRRRYRRELRIGVGVGVVGIAIAAYLATRNVPEG